MRSLSLFAAASILACSSSHDPVSVANQLTAGDVAISVDRTSLTWDEASTDGIRGTVRNTSDHVVYSNVGDAFNAAIEQDPLLIVDYSDGAVERQVSASTWTHVSTAVAIEGTRFVALQPGATYHFIANVTGTPHAGTHRISLSYRSTINDEEHATFATTHSPGFEIR